LRYDGRKTFRITGWLNDDRTIARIQDVKTKETDLIIIEFRRGEFNKLLEPLNEQCDSCGCSPCECHDLYPYCDKCEKYQDDASRGDKCPNCGETLI
jgi:hypothetical protein